MLERPKERVKRQQQMQILRVSPGMRDLEQILQHDFPEEGN